MNILIGGSAGQGMDTIAYLLSKTLARSGFGIHASKDYMSRVRGGHNFTRLRVDVQTPWSAQKHLQILIALNEETYHLHGADLAETSKTIFDPEQISPPPAAPGLIPIPLQKLAKELGGSIMANIVAVGAALALLGLETSETEILLTETFATEIAQQNIAALQAGYLEAKKACAPCFTLPQTSRTQPWLLLDGNQTLGMAALASGCRFLSAYPMTPATGIISYLAAKQSHFDIVVEQAEDEIAAINMAIGASYAGARAMTCTSGGGFALMVEGLSLAGITETPLVIVLAMRPGPATGLPTRTEQGDLEFALHAGHGEFPRAVLCATHPADAFYRLNKAFELAEKYQLPVIFLSDQNFADTVLTVPPFDFTRIRYNRYLQNESSLELPYKRYKLTEDGISPRVLPGQFAGVTVLADSDEHDEYGHIIEDAKTRTLMTNKRLQKMAGLSTEMAEPTVLGEESGDLLLVGWGSTSGALQEATLQLVAAGRRVTHLHYADLWPLPVSVISRLFPNFTTRICVENNATGQFAALLRRETGLCFDHEILKYDGRPFLAEDIVSEVENHV